MSYNSNELLGFYKNQNLIIQSPNLSDFVKNEKTPILPTKIKNKRNLELNLDDTSRINLLEGYKKKVDSPIVESFFDRPSLTPYETQLIEFINSENQYYTKLRQICSTYYGLLEKNREYNSIFTNEEKVFFFGDCLKLQEISYNFLKTLVENLIHYSAFKNQESVEKFKDSDADTSVLGYNIHQLVLNADLLKIDIGELINKMIGSREYRVQLILYLTKYSLKVNLLNSKLHLDDEVVKSWLRRANEILLPSAEVSLISLISVPVQRLFKYPIQIKALSDKILFQSNIHKLNLNISLVKVNQIIEKCYAQDKITALEDVKNLENKLEGEFQTKIAYDFDEVLLDSSKDVKLGIAGKIYNEQIQRVPKEPTPKITNQAKYHAYLLEFSHKYDRLKKLISQYTELSQKVILFMESQITYSNYWVNFLEDNTYNDSRFFNSIYSIYSAKLTEQIKMSRHFSLRYKEKVINPLQEAMSYCEKTKDSIILYQKQKDSYKSYMNSLEAKPFFAKFSQNRAQSCKEIMCSLRDQLPELLSLIDTVIDLTFQQYLLEYPKWLFQLIGERSWKEFQDLSQCDMKEKYHDIVQFYNQAMVITKTALEEESTMNMRYLSKLTI